MSNDTLTRTMQTYQSHEEPERLFAVAGIYWRLMLAIEICICCAAVAAGAYLLIFTLFDFNVTNTQESVVHTINRDQLSRTMRLFEERNLRFKELQAGGDTAVDPSR